jgi:NAD+ kinase
LKALADKIKNVGVIGNPDKAACFSAVSEAARLVLEAGRSLYSDPVTAELAGLKATVLPDAAALARQVDLLLVFGGDGTILRVAREIAGSRTPLLGINIGSLGFLTAVPSDQLPRALKQVWEGEFKFESRVLLRATGRCGAQLVDESALNDIVVGRGIGSRLIELDVRVDGDLLTRYRCDGLIVSSPTGSTAYSLAAGGAVIFPTAEVMALTPICPHTLSNRALILPLSATIEVTILSPRPANILSADGQVVTELSAGDQITIRRGRRAVRLMHLAGSSFCETLRHKLHWRGATL